MVSGGVGVMCGDGSVLTTPRHMRGKLYKVAVKYWGDDKLRSHF